ncbi:MAG: hypothetical protein J2P37_08150, partial [Ktedonobacteraceae bacterium]|nr:hypothetical protein [Ktedonobacteraceae bacterium]
IDDADELEALREVVEWHARRTRSKWAERLLDEWEQVGASFWRVQPRGTSTTARDFVGAGDYDGQLLRASQH